MIKQTNEDFAHKIKKEKDRWQNIEKLTSDLKNDNLDKEIRGRLVSDLLILLVEHLKPLYSYKDYENTDLNKMLNTFIDKIK